MSASLLELEAAVSLLQSIGVKGLCLPSGTKNERTTALDEEMQKVLPFCVPENDNLYYAQAEDGERVFESWQAKELFYLYNIVGVLLNIFFVAIMAGLYLGLLTLDVLDLQILERTSKDAEERRYAQEILPIVKERHLLLVTILLVDTLVYEALPVFLETLVPSWVAILLSCTLILLFGEIIPTGIFTGPNQLYLAFTLSPVVKFFIWFLYPIAKPIARLLDYLTRDEDENGNSFQSEYYDRGELSALVRIQHEEITKQAAKSSSLRRPTVKEVIKYQRNKDRQWVALKSQIMEKVNERFDDASVDDENETVSAAVEQLVPPLHPSEVDMIEGALTLGTRLAMDVYTPFSHVYSLPHDLILNKSSVTDIFSQGYSRVPVYRSNPDDPEDTAAYLGFLVTRKLMMIDWKDNRELSTMYLQRPTCVSPRTNLVEVLKILQNNAPQMSFVCARPDLANKALKAEEPIPVEAGLMGIITLVDIMESILQDRIYDEGDIRDRDRDRAVSTLTRWAATKLQSFLLKKTKEIQIKRRFSAGRTGSSLSPLRNRGDGSTTMVLPDSTAEKTAKHVVRTKSINDVSTESTPLLSETADATLNGTARGCYELGHLDNV